MTFNCDVSFDGIDRTENAFLKWEDKVAYWREDFIKEYDHIPSDTELMDHIDFCDPEFDEYDVD